VSEIDGVLFNKIGVYRWVYICDFGERKGGKNKYKSLDAGLKNFFLVYLSLL
jgi:hypothetical protein